MNATKTKKYQHIFFDLDNTLTKSRSQITQKMRKLLESLSQDVVVISGATLERAREQLGDLECFILAQNGNHAVFGEEELWFDMLKPDKVIEVMDHATSLPRTWEVPDENDLLHNMGCQIGFSLYGIHAPIEEKKKFDPDRSLRKRLLKEHPLHSDTIEVTITGTTSLDYTRKGKHKGYNIERLLEHLGWDREDCVYFGDELQKDGNDFSVIGVIDTIPVKDPADTYEKMQEMLL